MILTEISVVDHLSFEIIFEFPPLQYGTFKRKGYNQRECESVFLKFVLLKKIIQKNFFRSRKPMHGLQYVTFNLKKVKSLY